VQKTTKCNSGVVPVVDELAYNEGRWGSGGTGPPTL
jgi:hypothetical protein